MGRPIKVLIVEDSEDDALLLISELKKGGYDPDFERVETREAMEKALSGKEWDIVISDYKMPHFEAPEALELLQSKGLDIPFIVVSGTVGEDIAVEMMKEGAHDYIMKGNLVRLCADVERETRDAGIRREHKKLTEDMEKRMHELEVFYEASVGREERIAELKNEVEELKKKLGERGS